MGRPPRVTQGKGRTGTHQGWWLGHPLPGLTLPSVSGMWAGPPADPPALPPTCSFQVLDPSTDLPAWAWRGRGTPGGLRSRARASAPPPPSPQWAMQAPLSCAQTPASRGHRPSL